MKKEFIGLIVLTLISAFFTLSQVNAQFSYANNSIESYYNGGEFLRGYVNFSLTNQDTSSILKDSFNNNISLLNFIELNGLKEGIDYNCSVSNCTSQYISSGNTIASINLNSDEQVLMGFKIPSGNDVSITSMSLTGNSDLGQTDQPGTGVNFVGWNFSSAQYYAYTNQTSTTENYGCFLNSNSQETTIISSTPICQKITLPSSPAFLLGAILTNVTIQTNGIGPLMQLYYANDGYIANAPQCYLQRLNSTAQKVSCVVQNPGARAGDYYVCISDNSKAYQINSDSSSSNICGGSGTDFGPNYFDNGANYNIFARGLKFNSSQFVINDTSYSILNTNTLVADASNYINNVYANNCSSGCIIPFLVDSKYAQTLNLSGSISYSKGNSVPTTNKGLYYLSSVNSTVSSNYINLDISKANFTLPLSTSQTKLSLFIDGNTLVSNIPINVSSSFAFDVTPKTALVGIDTIFSLTLAQNISSVIWKFGDNSPDITTQNGTVNHRYSQNGIFNLQVEIDTQDGQVAKRVIPIIVGNPTEAFNLLITKYSQGINNISDSLNSYDSWVKDAILQKLNLTSMNDTLNNINTNFNNATDDNKVVLLNQLISLNAPYGIIADFSGALPIDVGFENINVDPALALSDGNFSDLTNIQKDNIKLKIIKWDTDNYQTNIDYKQISKQTDSGAVPIFTQLKLTIKSSSSTPSNLIIYYPKDQIIFKDNYNQNGSFDQSSTYTLIPITGDKTIEFLIPDKVNISDLGMYITPDMKELGVVVDAQPPTPENGNRPQTAKWFYILLIFIFIVVYLALQEWYKFRYESHLFKNRDDLYNIINFIFNARVARNSDNQIMIQLEKYNWSNEQLTYAFKKIDGKRTGMWEIPVFKFLENRKVVKEIDKRKQPNSGDGRFIKTNY